MWKKIGIISILCPFLAALPVSGFEFRPGKYEVSIQMEVPGMPGGIPTQTMMQCLSGDSPVPGSNPAAQGCEVTEMQTSGNTVTYKMECSQHGMQAKISGMVTYTGDAFEGTTRTTMAAEAGNVIMTTAVRGKRIGECDAAQ